MEILEPSTYFLGYETQAGNLWCTPQPSIDDIKDRRVLVIIMIKTKAKTKKDTKIKTITWSKIKNPKPKPIGQTQD